MLIEEQERVLENNKKNMLVSASAGSGKTYIMIKYITQLICEKRVPLKNFLVLTFTKAAATEMKERLETRLKEKGQDEFIIEQLDALSVSNISTIHSFCEKSLKKYANILGLNENFEIADESVAQKIRKNAFAKALKTLKNQNEEKFNLLMSNFKNSESKIASIMFEVENLVNSVADKESFLNENKTQGELLFEKALNYLFDYYKFNFNIALKEVEKMHVNDFEFELSKQMYPLLQAKDLFEMAVACEKFVFPYLPKRKEVGDEVVNNLQSIKDDINKNVKNVLELNLTDKKIVEMQKSAELEKSLLYLFDIYEQEEQDIKKTQNYLDFYDLEKYMKKLSQTENLFSELQYVFVDEYQDTNKVQEKIIKNVAKNCNFVAVGDVKQGIYGFRLASSDIFLKDLNDFEFDEDSTVNYLQSNFRSSQKVLDFVNNIFKVCMTKETVGVDYLNSSMLKGMTKFEDNGEKAVIIDMLTEQESENEALPKIYSVKEAQINKNDSNKNLLLDIKRRINEVMSQSIWDNGEFRKCRFSDIAILSRKRDPLFNDLEVFLQENEIPVFANSRSNLLDEPEIEVLLNCLKLALNFDDDIALLSVLLSGLFSFDIEIVTQEKTKNDLSLCQIVLEDKNSVFSTFNEKMRNFKKNIQIFGAKIAFLELFNQTNYRAYLNFKTNAGKLNLFVDRFIAEIVASGLEFDLPGLISHFEGVDIPVVAEVSAVGDSVLLTTIHNSKGLEYPIVFLIGCDQSLKKAVPKVDVEINEEFGLAVKLYDQENNNEISTVKMRAIKESQAKKDFTEEMMIFYVALTRAKNKLYLFGQLKDSVFEKYSVFDCDSYFDMIMFSMPQIKNALKNGDCYLSENLSANVIEKVLEENLIIDKSERNEEVNWEIYEKIKNYLNYNYKFDERLNFKLKESVTSLNKIGQEDVLEKYSTESFNFGGEMVEKGNAYHLALKVLDFEKISSMEDLLSEKSKHKEVFDKIAKWIDFEVLLKNILILKKFTLTGTVYKEKEFILKDKLSNILEDCDFDDEIMVQGIVDLFVVDGQNAVLVDYKYTNSNNINYLINKYKNQLKLYKMAVENGFNLKINEIYLLSLKNNKLIPVEI